MWETVNIHSYRYKDIEQLHKIITDKKQANTHREMTERYTDSIMSTQNQKGAKSQTFTIYPELIPIWHSQCVMAQLSKQAMTFADCIDSDIGSGHFGRSE